MDGQTNDWMKEDENIGLNSKLINAQVSCYISAATEVSYLPYQSGGVMQLPTCRSLQQWDKACRDDNHKFPIKGQEQCPHPLARRQK